MTQHIAVICPVLLIAAAVVSAAPGGSIVAN